MSPLSLVVNAKVDCCGSTCAQSNALPGENFDLEKFLRTEESTRKYLCELSKYHTFCFTTNFALLHHLVIKDNIMTQNIWLIKSHQNILWGFWKHAQSTSSSYFLYFWCLKHFKDLSSTYYYITNFLRFIFSVLLKLNTQSQKQSLPLFTVFCLMGSHHQGVQLSTAMASGD